MEAMFSFVGIIIIVFGILQIILFFKMWGMTNNVSEMKNMMELLLRKDFQNKENLGEPVQYSIPDNTECDKENFPENTKFQKGDIVLYKPENTKLIVIEYAAPNVVKCQTIDGTNKTYCFQENYLDKCTD